MEIQPRLSPRDRRNLLRGATIAAPVMAVMTQIEAADAQTNCTPKITIVDQSSGRFEAAQVLDPVRNPGGRTQLSNETTGTGSNTAIVLQVKESPRTVVRVRPNGERYIPSVEVYDHNARKYVRENGQPLQMEVPCDVGVNLRINRFQPIPTVGATATPGAGRGTGAPAVSSTETATPTATATKTETPTPTQTPTAIPTVTYTPTRTETATPWAVTSTPEPLTPTPIVVTGTPTSTPNIIMVTPTPNPVAVGREIGFWEGVICVTPLVVGGLGAAALFAYANSRNNEAARMGGYGATETEDVASQRYLETLRHELTEIPAVPLVNRLRNWRDSERAVMLTVDTTAAAASNLTKDSIGLTLANVLHERSTLDINHRRLLNALRDTQARLAGTEAEAKAVVDAQRVADQARHTAYTGVHADRVNAFNATKTADDLRRTFVIAHPNHPLSIFDFQVDQAMSVQGREPLHWYNLNRAPRYTY